MQVGPFVLPPTLKVHRGLKGLSKPRPMAAWGAGAALAALVATLPLLLALDLLSRHNAGTTSDFMASTAGTPFPPAQQRRLWDQGKGAAEETEGQRADYSGYRVLRAEPATESHLSALSDTALERAGIVADLWVEPRRVGTPVDIMIHANFSSRALEYLHLIGVPFTTMIGDVQEAAKASHPALAPSRGRLRAEGAGETFALDKYHTFEEIMQWLEALAASHESVASLVTVGDTYENRSVMGIKIHGSATPRPVIFLTCGLHAREWISPASCIYVIEALVSRYPADPTVTWLVSTFEWHIVPIANADGYVYTWTGDRLWRKTRRPQAAGCIGADANRNWQDHRCEELRSQSCSEVFCGDFAFSEPCVQNIRQYLLRLNSTGADIQAYVDIHAYSQLWMWPWGWTRETNPDDRQQAACGKAAADAIYAVHQTLFETGPIAQTIYEVGGSSTDWAYDVLGVKFAYAAELRDEGRHGFLLPPDQIIPSGEEVLAGITGMAACIFARR